MLARVEAGVLLGHADEAAALYPLVVQFRAQGVVERRTTIPILSNVLLEAEGDKLWICAGPANAGTDRPADFTTSPDSGAMLFEYEREAQ